MTDADIYKTDAPPESDQLTTAPTLSDYKDLPDDMAETLALQRLGLHRITNGQEQSR